MNKQRASSVIHMCVYFQEKSQTSQTTWILKVKPQSSSRLHHHEAVLLLSNMELLIQTFSPGSIIVAHASPGPAPPLTQTTQHSHAAPVLAPLRLLSANLLLLATQVMPHRWTLLGVADSCLLPGSSGGLSLLDKCVKTETLNIRFHVFLLSWSV